MLNELGAEAQPPDRRGGLRPGVATLQKVVYNAMSGRTHCPFGKPRASMRDETDHETCMFCLMNLLCRKFDARVQSDHQ